MIFIYYDLLGRRDIIKTLFKLSKNISGKTRIKDLKIKNIRLLRIKTVCYLLYTNIYLLFIQMT